MMKQAYIVKPYINVRSLNSLRGKQNAEERLQNHHCEG